MFSVDTRGIKEEGEGVDCKQQGGRVASNRARQGTTRRDSLHGGHDSHDSVLALQPRRHGACELVHGALGRCAAETEVHG